MTSLCQFGTHEGRVHISERDRQGEACPPAEGDGRSFYPGLQVQCTTVVISALQTKCKVLSQM